jgi:SLA1 homology domain 1, SHD1
MRFGKMMMTWVVAGLMIVDSASACRWRCWSYCGPPPCYYPSYTSCGPWYPASDCPPCAPQEGAPVTTNRAPSQPAVPTPPPKLEPMPAPTAPPAEAPAPAQPPAAAPAPSEPPTKLPPAEPALKPADNIQDLFKEPAPSATPSEPAPKPAATPPSDVEDLFKQPATPSKPAAKPGDDVDNLFKETPAATPPAAEPAKPSDGADNLFKGIEDKNATAPADTTGKATDREVEDLFSEPTNDAPMSASADETKALQNEVDKLFADPARPAASAENADTVRLWTDNTGKYHVRARLVSVTATHVRLLKENGRYTTVPVERLSRDDLAFARRHADRAIVASF